MGHLVVPSPDTNPACGPVGYPPTLSLSYSGGRQLAIAAEHDIMHYFCLFFLFVHICIVLAAPNHPLKPRYPSDVPSLPFPDGRDAKRCPTAYTNLFNQGVQRRSFITPSDDSISQLRSHALNTRQADKCLNIAHMEWTGFPRPLGNTQDLFLFGTSTYTFIVAASVPIKLAYAWTAPYNSDHYTLIGTGGNGGKTAEVTVKLDEDSHVHFEAFSDYTMSNGAAAVYKIDD